MNGRLNLQRRHESRVEKKELQGPCVRNRLSQMESKHTTKSKEREKKWDGVTLLHKMIIGST